MELYLNPMTVDRNGLNGISCIPHDSAIIGYRDGAKIHNTIACDINDDPAQRRVDLRNTAQLQAIDD